MLSKIIIIIIIIINGLFKIFKNSTLVVKYM